MGFWAIAVVMALVATGLSVWPILRRSRTVTSAAEFDVAFYRGQLAEVDSDLAKGVIGAAEADEARAEIKRRMLDADRDARGVRPEVTAPALAGKVAALVVLAAVLGGGVLTYRMIGAEGAADLPLAGRDLTAPMSRPSQAVAEAAIGDNPDMLAAADQSYIDLVQQLRDTVATRPDDVRGHELLANHEARLGRFKAAHEAMARVVDLKGPETTAADYTDWAELMIVAAGGYVSPEAEQALARAIKMDPANPRTRYYSGLDLAQNGRPDLAYRLWSDLLDEGPADAPWIAPIREQIAEVARMAGITPGLKGPGADDLKAAEGMTEADRQQMIRGMVAGLAERLATEGGTAEEWARLIRAYGVLGEADRAAAIWGEAQNVFAGKPELDVVRAAARDAGVAE